MYFNVSVYTYLYVFTLCLFYFFAAVAQNHFPQLGISPAGLPCAAPSLLSLSASSFVATCFCATPHPTALGKLKHSRWPSRWQCVAGSIASIATACGTYAVHSFMNAFYMAVGRRRWEKGGGSRWVRQFNSIYCNTCNYFMRFICSTLPCHKLPEVAPVALW